MKLKVIITGATGMVGEGVLFECLENPMIGSVLVVGRKPCKVSHAKLKEIILPDFFELKNIEPQLAGYNACFFCLGISSVGVAEPEYYKVTYTLTLNFATILSRLNPEMTFCYVSGAGTDTSEKGKLMWARVKGKTENDLMKLPFRQAFNFRPGFLKPIAGQNNVLVYYKYLIWLYPLLKLVMPGFISTLGELGKAMINASIYGSEKKILEVSDILKLAKSEK